MGKYSKITAGLKRWLDTEPAYQEKVDATKREILAPISKADADWLDYDTKVDSFIARTRTDLDDALFSLTRGVACQEGQYPHASAYATVYGRLKDVENFIKECESKFNLLKTSYVQLMDEAYEREDVTNLKLADGDSCRLEISPKLVIRDQEKYREWCKKNGFEKQMSIPYQTANADLKERLINGEDIPPGCEVFSAVKVVYTPAKE
jgi:hypothetical protein